ncbi:MAG: zinc-ribbon domain-containing protein [Acidobacteriota bacterium]|nr:zinc-ribbon domain-containing protein [Blastocatellia bacterium]MDW8411508.1 zinc-ribbon domain-containing protein [Acidobacteriota bacterium]
MFDELNEPDKSVKQKDRLICSKCKDVLSGGASVKYLASSDDLVEAGFPHLVTMKLLVRQSSTAEGTGRSGKSSSGLPKASPAAGPLVLPVASPATKDEVEAEENKLEELDFSIRRCSKCGSEIAMNAQTCPNCGYNLGTIGRPKYPLVKKKTGLAKYLPESLVALKVPPQYAVLAVVILLALLSVGYFRATGQVCLGCVQVTGTYKVQVKTQKGVFDITVMLTQVAANIGGQVQLVEAEAQTRQDGTSKPPKQYMGILQVGKVNGDAISFQTYPKDAYVEFLGNYDSENALIKGQMKLEVSELGLSETISIVAGKSAQ